MRAHPLVPVILCLATSLALLGGPITVAHAEKTVVIDGQVPDGGADHLFIPFDLSDANIREIEIRHDDRSASNILDFGLYDPNGFRGWGGGTSEATIVSEQAASRGYVPGPLPLGRWQVVIGKAKIVDPPAVYHLEIVLRETPTLAKQNRRSYVPSAALSSEHRYYAGDLHVHSRESTDANPTLEEIAQFAKGRGLDFVAISDHNIVTQLDSFGDVQKNHPDLLFLPAIEVTTYAGHLGAIGATRFIDHKVGQPSITIDSIAAQVAAQNAILSINHPRLSLGDACIGCAWMHNLPADKIQAVEVATGGLRQGGLLFTPAAIRFWDDLLTSGQHIAALGGSDDHQAGKASGRTQSPIGDPTTLILAKELSAAALIDGIRHGRTVVKLQGPEDPMVELSSGDSVLGDTVLARSLRLVLNVKGGRGSAVRLVVDGEAQPSISVDADPFVLTSDYRPRPGTEQRIRAEAIVDGQLRTLTSHLYVQFSETGRDDLAETPSHSSLGCVQARHSMATPFAPLFGGVALLLIGCVRRLITLSAAGKRAANKRG